MTRLYQKIFALLDVPVTEWTSYKMRKNSTEEDDEFIMILRKEPYSMQYYIEYDNSIANANYIEYCPYCGRDRGLCCKKPLYIDRGKVAEYIRGIQEGIKRKEIDVSLEHPKVYEVLGVDLEKI